VLIYFSKRIAQLIYKGCVMHTTFIPRIKNLEHEVLKEIRIEKRIG